MTTQQRIERIARTWFNDEKEGRERCIAALTAFAEEEAKDATLPVIDLTAMQVIARAVNYPHKWACGTPRWSAVGGIFGLGSTSSQKLCRLCGENPNDIRLRNGRIKLAQPLPEAPKQD